LERDIFIPKEQRVEINLHDMQVLEAEYYLDKFISTLPEDIKEVTVVHGYKKGQAILNMVRKEFKHKRIKSKVIPYNRGTTIFYLY